MVDRRKTSDAVKRFCLELRGCCRESSSTERGRTWPLNRILEAAKYEESPNGLSVSKMRGACFWNGWGSTKYRGGDARAKAQVPLDLAAGCRSESVKGGSRDALNGEWDRRQKTASKAAVFCRLSTHVEKYTNELNYLCYWPKCTYKLPVYDWRGVLDP